MGCSCGGKNPITRGFATRGGIFSTTPPNPLVGENCDLFGNRNVPFVTHGELQIQPLVASPLVVEFPIPTPPHDGIGSFQEF